MHLNNNFTENVNDIVNLFVNHYFSIYNNNSNHENIRYLKHFVNLSFSHQNYSHVLQSEL